MAPAAGLTEAVLYDTLVNYLISMARVVESAMNRALDAIIAFDNPRTSALPGEVFLLEPRINEMEIMIDEHAIRLLRRGSFTDDEMRLVVAALKITNDLERIGDIAVNLAERVISLREMPDAKPPEELAPMVEAVRSMVSRSLGSLIFRNAETCRAGSGERRHCGPIPRPHLREPAAPHDRECCARHSRNAVRAGHAPSGAHRGSRHEYRRRHHLLVRGLDVRHGRGLTVRPESEMTTMGLSSEVTENSHGLHSDVTPNCETQRVLNFTQCPTLGTGAPLAPVPTSSP